MPVFIFLYTLYFIERCTECVGRLPRYEACVFVFAKLPAVWTRVLSPLILVFPSRHFVVPSGSPFDPGSAFTGLVVDPELMASLNAWPVAACVFFQCVSLFLTVRFYLTTVRVRCLGMCVDLPLSVFFKLTSGVIYCVRWYVTAGVNTIPCNLRLGFYCCVFLFM